MNDDWPSCFAQYLNVDASASNKDSKDVRLDVASTDVFGAYLKGQVVRRSDSDHSLDSNASMVMSTAETEYYPEKGVNLVVPSARARKQQTLQRRATTPSNRLASHMRATPQKVAHKQTPNVASKAGDELGLHRACLSRANGQTPRLELVAYELTTNKRVHVKTMKRNEQNEKLLEHVLSQIDNNHISKKDAICLCKGE